MRMNNLISHTDVNATVWTEVCRQTTRMLKKRGQG